MNIHDIAAEGAVKQAQSEAEAFENAIKRIRPKEESMNINGKWYTESEIQAYVKELESKLAELEDKHHNECGQIAHYDDELGQAKELLHESLPVLKAAIFANYKQTNAANELYDRIKKAVGGVTE